MMLNVNNHPYQLADLLLFLFDIKLYDLILFNPKIFTDDFD